MQEVQDAALEERVHLWVAAAEASGARGRPQTKCHSRTEADFRVFAHDALAPHHDKDFRYLTDFGTKCLMGVVLLCGSSTIGADFGKIWCWEMTSASAPSVRGC